jgi:hypothetical protein
VLSCIYQYDKLGRLFWGKLFKWVGKTLKWIGIAAAIAVAVISIAFPGAWIANLALWASKHSILSAVLGINTPKFAIINLASLGAKSGAIALARRRGTTFARKPALKGRPKLKSRYAAVRSQFQNPP